MKILNIFALCALLPTLMCCNQQKDSSIEISISNHRFQPDIVDISAGKKVELIITNLDDTAEEFESFELKRERIIPAKSTAKILLGPLQPGTYKFFGEFHEQTAQGKIIVK
jgi:plastocyanin